MNSFIYNAIFLIISLIIFCRTLGYAFYEINELKNKSGGITIIVLSIFVVIFSNIMMFVR